MSEFKDLQPEVCEVIKERPSEKICPTCKPDPSYIEPTWWNTDEPYLNKKICEYQINMVSTKSVAGLVESEIKYEARKLVKKGIREILRKLGKLETNEIVCAFPPQRKKQKCRLYIPPNLLIKLELDVADLEINENIKYNKEDPDGRFNPDSLEVAATVADIYYGDNFELFQVLVSIPATAIDTLPNSPFSNEDQESLNEEAQNTKEVELDGYDFRGNIRKLKAAFLLYGKYQMVFSYTQDIRLVQYVDANYIPFYLKKYRSRIEAFKEELREVIKANGYRLSSVKSRKTVEKIKIKFDDSGELKIKSIFVKKKGCPYEKLRGLRKLKDIDSTTMNYIINLEDMIEELSFKEDIPWLDFVTEYTYPALEINFGDIDNNEEPLTSCIDNESVDNFKDNVLKSLLSFSEAIQFTLSTKECKTLKEITENNPYDKQRLSLKESAKKRKKNRKDKRKERETDRRTKDEIAELEDQLVSAQNELQVQELIKSIQEKKEDLYDVSSEDDDLTKLKLQKKIMNSTYRSLQDKLKELDNKIDDVQDNEWFSLEEKLDEIAKFNNKKDLIDAKRSELHKEIENIEKEIKELKKDQKKTKKEEKDLNYDKVKDLFKESYEERRKELTLIDSLKQTKDEDRGGFQIMRVLNPCKWDQVNLQVVECLLGGMSFADAIPLIIKATLKNTNPYVLENLLIGLPMEERKKVVDKVKAELKKVSADLAENFKEPWESQKEKDKEEEKGDSSADNQTILDENPAEQESKFDPKEKRKDIAELKKDLRKQKNNLVFWEKEYNDLKKAEETFEQFEQLTKLENELIPQTQKKISSLEEQIGKDVEEFKQKQTGSSPALSNIAGIIFDAYIEAITNSLSIDRLTAMLDDIPGANIFKKLILEATCPRVNTMKSGIQDAFGAISVEFCDPDSKNYFLPAIPSLPRFRRIGLGYALGRMVAEFTGALTGLLAELIIALIIRILDLIENGLCNSIGVLGALLANALTGQKGKNGFLDAVNDAFCENEDSKQDTATDLLGKAGIPFDRRADITNALSSAATKNEIKKALISDCEDQNPKVMKAIWAVFKASGLKLNGMFQTPDDVRDMFCMMGSYLTQEQRDVVALSFDSEDVPVNTSICLTNPEREQWDKARRNFYTNQGLDPNAARNFVDGLNKKMNLDLIDMIDNMAKGPEGLLQEALAEALKPRDPNCKDATNSLMPEMPEELKAVFDAIAEGVFGSLAYSFTTDMIGKRDSFFENILADQRGVRLSAGLFSHERRVGSDLLFPNAANTTEEHEQKFEEAGLLQKGVMKALSKGLGDPDPDHLFPETIGLYFQQRILELLEQKFATTTEKQGKRKKPDLLLKFRDVSEDEGLEFDFGFNIAYNNFKYPNKHVRSDEFSIRKFDIIKTKESTSKSVDLKVKSKHGVNKYKEVLEKYDITESELTLPYVTQLFGEVLKDRYSKAGATNLTSTNIGSMYDSINNLIYGGLFRTLVEDPRDPENLPTGYLFGYKDDKVTYEDLLYVNPNATSEKETWEYTHEEEDAVLGKSATGSKRVKFLDPAKYGGKYTKPKVYIEQAEHDGWFRIAQMIVPEIDGCSPKRTDFLFLNEISSKVSNLQSSIQTDKRYELEPDCVYEPAFDKLLPSSSHAYIEGIIAATIRAYCLETLLRTMPIVSHLRLDFKTNYSDIFLDFIIDKMEDTMQEQGTWPRRVRDYKYWTAFLEQTVQSSFRMLQRGDLKKDPELLELLQQALDVSKAYSRPSLEDKRSLFLVKGYSINTNGRIIDAEFRMVELPNRQKRRVIKLLNAMAYEAYGKDFQKELLKLKTRNMKLRTLNLQTLKDAERALDIHDNVGLAKKILRFHVSRELELYSEKIDEVMSPQTYIGNLSKFLLGASKIAIVSDTQAGLSEFESPIGDSAIPNYGTIPSVPSNNESPFTNLSSDQIETTKEMGGLFLQKYIRIVQKEETIGLQQNQEPRGTGIDRKINLEGMVSFDEFRTAIGDFAGDKTQHISDLLGDAVAIPELDTYDGSIGVKMGVRVCYVLPQGVNPFSSSEEALGAAKAINEDKAYFTNDDNGLSYFVPLAHYEQDIKDRTIEEINIEDEDFGEEIKCYFDKMVETDEFKFIFESLLITNKTSALAAIYSYDGFINSIGLGTDERSDEKERKRDHWKGRMLDDTKKRLLDLFSSYYLTHEKNKDQEREREEDRKQFLKNLLPDSLFNFDRNVRWWQLRRRTDRPYDKDGKDCASTLADIFKGDEE